MIYISAFLISILLIRKAYAINEENIGEIADKSISYKCLFLVLLSAIPLMILAVYRDTSIGHDIGVYQYSLYSLANQSNTIRQYYSISYVSSQIEPLYALTTYVGTKIAGLSGVFFLNEGLILLFTYLAIWDYKSEVDPQKSLACFLFIYYLHGYDIVRQSIAMSILLYMFTKLNKNKYLISLGLVLMAFMFHRSSIVGIAIIFLYYVSKRNLRRIYGILVLTMVGVITINFRKLFVLIINVIPFLPQKYIENRYIYLGGGVDVNSSKLLYIITAILILMTVYFFHTYYDIQNYTFFLYMMVLAIARITVGSQAQFAYRVFLYPEYFSVFVIPQYRRILSDKKANAFIGGAAFYALLIGYCIFFFMVRNVGEVYPYKFR